jgi:hypothetical protein
MMRIAIILTLQPRTENIAPYKGQFQLLIYL